MNTCENCGYTLPTESWALLDYCVHCSRNLCGDCLDWEPCPDSPNGWHQCEDDEPIPPTDTEVEG